MQNMLCKKITNVRQFECLIELMQMNPSVVKGFQGFGGTKANYRDIWKSLALKLNALGPPRRNGAGWLKVWNDLKNKVKKKVFNNKRSPIDCENYKYRHFSKMETIVINLLSLDDTMQPKKAIVDVAGIDVKKESEEESSINSDVMVESNTPPVSSQKFCDMIDFEEERLNIKTEDMSQISPEFTTSQKRGFTHEMQYEENEQQIKLDVMEEQTKILQRIEKTLKCNARYKRKTYQLKEKQFAVYENYLHEKLELLREKNKIELEMLEFKVEELKFKKSNL